LSATHQVGVPHFVCSVVSGSASAIRRTSFQVATSISSA